MARSQDPQDPAQPESFSDRLKQKYGEGVDPEVSIGGEPSEAPSGATSELLKRLAEHGVKTPRYKLEGEVARGGMGAILRVWDEDLRRHLAMKVVLGKGDAPSSSGTPQLEAKVLARFLEEAQVTGQLDHPGIVPVHELGLDADGRVYFTMKLVKGRDLKAIFDLVFQEKEGWNETRALGVILKACEAMAYAHKKGVIHRDLKPANIMVGSFGEVFVMDWGLARVLGRKDSHDIRLAAEAAPSVSSVKTERREEREDAPDSPLVTMDGDVMGTPAYMPPEQARGEVEKLSARSDVYAVGAMLYHLLARQMPYVPPGARVSNRSVLRWVLEGPPKPLNEINNEVSAELVAICEKAMARADEQRYADTLALAEDLRAYIEHRVVSAHETGTWAETRKWIQRNRPFAASLSAAIALTVIGAGLWSAFLTEAKANKALAIERTKVLGLADSVRLTKLVDRESTLGPALPECVDVYDTWIRDAQDLLERKEEHRATLNDLGGHYSSEPTNPGRTQGALTRHSDPEGTLFLNTLLLLLEKLDALPALVAKVTRERDSALGIEQMTVSGPDARERWGAACESIGALPVYYGLKLTPQIGLLPLGRDPNSGLWEFWHVQSGNEPLRDPATGRWRISTETGLVLVLVPGGQVSVGSKKIRLPDDTKARTWNEQYSLAEQSEVYGQPFFDPGHGEDEQYLESLDLAAFFVSKYELTQSQWSRLIGHNPSQHHDDNTFGDPLHPVDNVTWAEALSAASRLALALPTEVQWEYACRAGTSTPFSPGMDVQSLQGNANIADKRFAQVQGNASATPTLDDGFVCSSPVGIFSPNAFGLHDMHGNVWEWCLDFLSPEVHPRAGDGLSEEKSKGGRGAIRGGSWGADARNARSANRFEFGRDNTDGDVGLRMVRPFNP